MLEHSGDVFFGLCQEISDEAVLDRDLLGSFTGCLAGLADGDALDQLHHGRTVQIVNFHVLPDQLQPAIDLGFAAFLRVQLLFDRLLLFFQLTLLPHIAREKVLEDVFRQLAQAFVLLQALDRGLDSSQAVGCFAQLSLKMSRSFVLGLVQGVDELASDPFSLCDS